MRVPGTPGIIGRLVGQLESAFPRGSEVTIHAEHPHAVFQPASIGGYDVQALRKRSDVETCRRKTTELLDQLKQPGRQQSFPFAPGIQIHRQLDHGIRLLSGRLGRCVHRDLHALVLYYAQSAHCVSIVDLDVGKPLQRRTQQLRQHLHRFGTLNRSHVFLRHAPAIVLARYDAYLAPVAPVDGLHPQTPACP